MPVVPNLARSLGAFAPIRALIALTGVLALSACEPVAFSSTAAHVDPSSGPVVTSTTSSAHGASAELLPPSTPEQSTSATPTMRADSIRTTTRYTAR